MFPCLLCGRVQTRWIAWHPELQAGHVQGAAVLMWQVQGLAGLHACSQLSVQWRWSLKSAASPVEQVQAVRCYASPCLFVTVSVQL